MSTAAKSPLPILIVIVLAGMSLIQLLAPDLLPPGLTLFFLGIVFLILYVVNWIRDPVTLISGWILAGFGISFWASGLNALAPLGGVPMLFGLALAFFGIYFSMGSDVAIESRKWPLILGVLLFLVGVVLVIEGAVGREQLWSVVVPLIPAAIAVWYLVEWRRGLKETGEV